VKLFYYRSEGDLRTCLLVLPSKCLYYFYFYYKKYSSTMSNQAINSLSLSGLIDVFRNWNLPRMN